MIEICTQNGDLAGFFEIAQGQVAIANIQIQNVIFRLERLFTT